MHRNRDKDKTSTKFFAWFTLKTFYKLDNWMQKQNWGLKVGGVNANSVMTTQPEIKFLIPLGSESTLHLDEAKKQMWEILISYSKHPLHKVENVALILTLSLPSLHISASDFIQPLTRLKVSALSPCLRHCKLKKTQALFSWRLNHLEVSSELPNRKIARAPILRRLNRNGNSPLSTSVHEPSGTSTSLTLTILPSDIQ